MKKLLAVLVLVYLIPQGGFAMTVQLPKPQINKSVYLDQAIQQRRSVRQFKDKELTLEQISQLLWAADGITSADGSLRSAPSGGALYPLDLYVVKPDGVWQYLVADHALKLIIQKDLRYKLAKAALGQSSVADAPLDIVIVAEYSRITGTYGKRGIRYAHIEAGHIAQNLLLEATALGLAGVPAGAFSDREVSKVLDLARDQDPLYIVPIGYQVR